MPSENTKRIAKNTLMLYFRMLFLMIITLYTSRIKLQALGVEDFGILNVVGGFVVMFAVVSKSLSSAASRFLNFEMGKGKNGRLSTVFSTILVIHIALAVIIAILTEGLGVWFVNNKMVIPHERLGAANWVFQFSVLTFCFNLITVPYNATIIAHEQMKIYAYIGLLEGVVKLLICYLILISPIDRLVFYSFLMFLLQFIVRNIYRLYCRKHYPETKQGIVYDKTLLKEVFSFAGWNTIGASANILRNQGISILLNLFGGPVINAARGVANQVLHAIEGFVSNFLVAINPQITKSYARGDRNYMIMLVFRSSRLSYFMMLLLGLPIFLNTDYILRLWLKTVPEYSVIFVQLTLIFHMIEVISRPLVTVQLATGNIRNYQLIVGGLSLMNLPVSYVLLKLGAIPEVVYFVAITLSVCMLIARLIMLRKMIDFDVLSFIKNVIINVLIVTVVSAPLPWLLSKHMDESFLSLCIVTAACLLISGLTVYFIGFTKDERTLAVKAMNRITRRIKDRNK